MDFLHNNKVSDPHSMISYGVSNASAGYSSTVSATRSGNRLKRPQHIGKNSLSEEERSTKRKPVPEDRHHCVLPTPEIKTMVSNGRSRAPRREVDQDTRIDPGKDKSRHRKSRRDRSRPPSSSRGSDTDVSFARPLPELWAWIDHIPQSADDQTIISRVGGIFAIAEQFVNNFYIDHASNDAVLSPFLEKEAFSFVPEDGSALSLLCGVAHPTTIIKHSLVATLLSAISLECKDHLPPLLPMEFMSMNRAIRHSKAPDHNIQHYFSAFSAHRVLTHYLRRNVFEDESYIKARDEAIDEIATDIEAVFEPWTNKSRDPEHRGPALIGLLQQTAELGVLLFAQPSTFLFDWQVRESSSRYVEVAIAPRMLKVYDEHARQIEPSQRMFETRTERTSLVVHEPLRSSVESKSSRPLASKGEQSNEAEQESIPVELPAQELMRLHELPGNIEHSFQTSGPITDMPDCDHANGEGLSFADDVHLRFGTLTEESQDYSEFRGSKPYEQRSWQSGAANSNTLPNGQAIPTRLRNGKVSTSQPPPTSYHLVNGNRSIGRSGSVDRGRQGPVSQHHRGRSRSETRSISARSSTWSPDQTDGREREVLLANLADVSGRYASARSENQRIRDQRNGAVHPAVPPPDEFTRTVSKAAPHSNREIEDKRHIHISNPPVRPNTSAGHSMNNAEVPVSPQCHPVLSLEDGQKQTILNHNLREAKPKKFEKWRSRVFRTQNVLPTG